MPDKQTLLQRLEDIGRSLAGKEEAIALFGLGSAGAETERMDEFSDLDFFVLAAEGCKQPLINCLDWLEQIHPLAYRFKNCELGYKFLFEDGIYGEFAVFEPDELSSAQYKGGRMVWKRSAFVNDTIVEGNSSIPPIRRDSIDHVAEEAITNLYVGLGRYLRGEKLSAFKFIQSYPIDGLLSIMHLLEQETSHYPDLFGNERRMERRFPRMAEIIGELLPGYNQTPEAALRMLALLESIYPVNGRMSREIRALAERCIKQRTEDQQML